MGLNKPGGISVDQGNDLEVQDGINTFIPGVNHQETLNFLTERLNEIARGKDVPRVVILKGHSGIGKARI